MDTLLRLQHLAVRIDGNTIVEDIDFELPHGEIGCLLGPSGCGKTTLLRAIAGFAPLSAGQITLDNQVVSTPGRLLPPEQRDIGMVFQDFALFPHLTVADNVRFGIRRQRATQQRQRIAELLTLVGLADKEHRYPHELSGGQQQRVALARALAPRPKLLLLDEPFGSQDVEIREALANEVRDILRQQDLSAMLVTHDQHEAFVMADQIGVMQQGRLQQWGTADALYHHPANRFVGSFIGDGSLLRGRVSDRATVVSALGEHPIPTGNTVAAGDSVELLIRPQSLQLDPKGDIRATVLSRAFRGGSQLYTLKLDSGETVLSHDDSRMHHEPGALLSLRLAQPPGSLFPGDHG